MRIVDDLLREFDDEMGKTRKILERTPEGPWDYKPHAKSMPLDRLAGHIAELPGWARATLESELLELQPGQKSYVAESRADLLKTFDRNVAEARTLLEKTTDEDLRKTWTMKFAGKEVMSMPRITVWRSVVMNHMIHHRAQLGVYLRLNEIEIPGMYGPSADEAKWWETKTA